MIGESSVCVTLAGHRVRLPHDHAARLARSPAIDLTVDLNRERIAVAGRELSLEASLIPLRILAALVRAHGMPLSIPDLFALAWGRPYSARHHHNTFHSQMSRLRRFLRETARSRSARSARQDRGSGSRLDADRTLILTEGATYRIAPGLRACLIDPVAMPAWRSRRPGALVAIARARGFIDRRMVCAATGLTGSRAHELLQMVARTGALVLEGSGRGARYRAPQQPVPSSSSKMMRKSSATLHACEMQPAGR